LQLEDGRTLNGTLESAEITDGTVWDAQKVGTFSLERP
jgi:hypothetical protein